MFNQWKIPVYTFNLWGTQSCVETYPKGILKYNLFQWRYSWFCKLTRLGHSHLWATVTANRMHRLIVIFSPPIRFIFQRNVYLAPIKLLKCQLLKHESAQLHLDLESARQPTPSAWVVYKDWRSICHRSKHQCFPLSGYFYSGELAQERESESERDTHRCCSLQPGPEEAGKTLPSTFMQELFMRSTHPTLTVCDR